MVQQRHIIRCSRKQQQFPAGEASWYARFAISAVAFLFAASVLCSITGPSYSSATISSLRRALFVHLQRGGLGNPLSHFKHKGGITASDTSSADTRGNGVPATIERRRSIVWASGSALSRVLEVGVVDLEAELEERRGCQKDISARISGPFPLSAQLCAALLRL